MESEFPSNSKLPKTQAHAKETPKKVEKVVVNEVVTRKKSLGKRLSETFLGDNLRNAFEYVMYEVLVPSAKDTVADMMSQGTERILFNEVRSTSRRGYSRGASERTPYHRINSSRREEPRDRERTRRARSTHNFDEFILKTRAEALEVIDLLRIRVEKYDFATVANLYDMLGETGEYTDTRWGWTDLSRADIIKVNQGYLLDLPRPEPID